MGIKKPTQRGTHSPSSLNDCHQTLDPVNSCSTMDYPTEQALVDGFIRNIRSPKTPWECLHISTEFFYQRGKADIVVQNAEGDVIAFEAKLRKWRVALNQAYRNTCFANRSYVLLPKAVALLASQYAAEFRRRQVGICYIDLGRIHILEEAEAINPLQQWLSLRAIESMKPVMCDDCPTN